MTIGGHVLSNVPAAVAPNGAEMLLGFNVLNRVSGEFAINVANSTLDFD
jgi:predicted aspartyl protease